MWTFALKLLNFKGDTYLNFNTQTIKGEPSWTDTQIIKGEPSWTES